MAEINMQTVKGPELKTNINILNESGLLPEAIVVRPGRKNADLATEFVAGIEMCNDIGKLDDVPEAVFNYYTSIVVPTKPAAAAAAPAGAATTAPATGAAPAAAPPAAAPAAAKPAGRGRAKAKPAAAPAAAAPATGAAAPPAAKPAKITRADVFAQIVKDGQPRDKAALEAAMNAGYDGSTKDTAFWVSCYTRLCLALGLMVKNEDKTLTYTG